MSLNNLGLGFVFTAKDMASGVIKGVESNFAKMEKTTKGSSAVVKEHLKTFGKGLGLFGAGVATVATGFHMAEQADPFLRAIEQAGARAGATEEELRQLRAAAIDLGLKGTGVSATVAAEGIRELMFEGMNAGDAMRALAPAMRLAQISFGQLSGPAAAGFLEDTLSQFNMTAAESGLLVDKMALAMRQFGLPISEVQMALRSTAQAAALTGTSLDETLVSFGLAKTVLPNAMRAARAVGMAMQALAGDKTQKELKGLIGNVTDLGTGKLRPLTDILVDVAAKTQGMTQAQRASRLASIFGQQAAGGLSAMIDALGRGVKDASGNVLTGAAAVDELRRKMGHAAGTAEEMRAKSMDGFGGVMDSLRAVRETLRTQFGEPFAEAFKPVGEAIRAIIQGVGRLVEAIPGPVKAFIAKMVVAVGGLVMALGTLVMAKAGIAILGVALNALGITAAGVLGPLLPIAAIIAGVMIAAIALKAAFDRNFGGIRDTLTAFWSKVQLVFGGIGQLFNQGGFSGAIRKELSKAENSGIKSFLVGIYLFGSRVKAVFVGIAEGFAAGIEPMRPAFAAISDALRAVGRAFGLIGDAGRSAGAAMPLDVFRGFGQVIGWIVGAAFRPLAWVLRFVANLVEGFFGVIGEARAQLAPAFEALSGAVRALFDAFSGGGTAISQFAALGDEGLTLTDVFKGIAVVFKVVGVAIGMVVTGAIQVLTLAITGLVKVVTFLVDVFKFAWETVGRLAGAMTDAFQNAGDWVSATWNKILATVLGVVARLPEGLRVHIGLGNVDQWIADAEAAARQAEGRIQIRNAMATAPTTVSADRALAEARGAGVPAAAVAATRATVAASQGPSAEEIGASVGRVIKMQPIVVRADLSVDGEKVATAARRAERRRAINSFEPEPAPAGG